MTLKRNTCKYLLPGEAGLEAAAAAASMRARQAESWCSARSTWKCWPAPAACPHVSDMSPSICMSRCEPGDGGGGDDAGMAGEELFSVQCTERVEVMDGDRCTPYIWRRVRSRAAPSRFICVPSDNSEEVLHCTRDTPSHSRTWPKVMRRDRKLFTGKEIADMMT